MMNGKTHSSLLGLVGAYLLYLAWQLFDGMQKGESTMAPWVNILSIVFFALAGVGILIYAWKDWEKQKKREAEGEAEEEPTDDLTELRKE